MHMWKGACPPLHNYCLDRRIHTELDKWKGKIVEEKKYWIWTSRTAPKEKRENIYNFIALFVYLRRYERLPHHIPSSFFKKQAIYIVWFSLKKEKKRKGGGGGRAGIIFWGTFWSFFMHGTCLCEHASMATLLGRSPNHRPRSPHAHRFHWPS